MNKIYPRKKITIYIGKWIYLKGSLSLDIHLDAPQNEQMSIMALHI